MCRWDDGDYEWYVETESKVLADADTHCEDCGRMIAAGERMVRFTATRVEDDERPFVWVVFVPDPLVKWWVPGQRWHCIIDEANFDAPAESDAAIAAFEALGFRVDEEPDPRMPANFEPDHYCCVQCRAANYWLEKVCDQSVVLVASGDIIDHTGDYTPAELGPDFMTLAALAKQRWVTKDYGVLMSEDVISGLARRAVRHAVATGLHPD